MARRLALAVAGSRGRCAKNQFRSKAVDGDKLVPFIALQMMNGPQRASVDACLARLLPAVDHQFASVRPGCIANGQLE